MRVLAVLPGPALHGVVQHGRAVARLVRGAGADVIIERSLTVSRTPADLTHVQFTDALFGPHAHAAAAAYERWAGCVPGPVMVTLHDLPLAGADDERAARRRAAYRRVVRASDAVMVSSPHEADELTGYSPHVIPLPLVPLGPLGPSPAWADRPTVGVLGFIYPGKGHAAVVEAVPPGQRVVAAGGPSPGHADLVEELHRRAQARGVDLVVTGAMGADDLHAAVLAVTVPVAAYSTSGSSATLSTWLAAGRRPLTAPTAYTPGVLARWPDSLDLTQDLRTDIAAALAAPARSWLPAPLRSPDVGRLHLAAYRSCLP